MSAAEIDHSRRGPRAPRVTLQDQLPLFLGNLEGTPLVTSSIPAGVGINSLNCPQPQQLYFGMGKVLRINTDGSIPKDNPFMGRAGARPEIYALGIRDDQGIGIHPRTASSG